MNVIEIDHLTYSYPGAAHPTLKDITVKIEKGDFLAIVGNNGCGKSTFCKTLNGLIPQFISGDFQGSVRACGLDTRETDVGTLARKVGYVYQDFENQIIRPTVLDDASYACLNYAMPDYQQRGLCALEECGLSGRQDDFIWQLSGGQTHLLALAGAVSLQPEVLILDEPIAQLDPTHADRIYDVLRQLNEKQGKTIIVIEHHTEYIADFCKHVMLLKDGELQWMLPTEEALQRVEELQSCNIFPPQVTIAAHRMLQAGGFSEDSVKLPVTVEEGKGFFATKPANDIPEKRPFLYKSDEIAAAFENVSVSYRSVKGEPRTVFSGLNLEIRKGDKVALIGSNGAGKSTMMKLLVGLLKPSSGDVLINGKSIRELKPEALSRQISMVYQNPEDMFIKDSIGRDISYAMEVRHIQDSAGRTEQLLERFRLTQLKDRDGRLLSGGQMRRASLAIGIALNPGILLLDEPTASLDIYYACQVFRLCRERIGEGLCVIAVLHDLRQAARFCTRLCLMRAGRVLADGSPDAVLTPENIYAAYGVRSLVFQDPKGEWDYTVQP